MYVQTLHTSVKISGDYKFLWVPNLELESIHAVYKFIFAVFSSCKLLTNLYSHREVVANGKGLLKACFESLHSNGYYPSKSTAKLESATCSRGDTVT